MEAEILKQEIIDLKTCIERALRELGVPTPDYPAPVANAVKILNGALKTGS